MIELQSGFELLTQKTSEQNPFRGQKRLKNLLSERCVPRLVIGKGVIFSGLQFNKIRDEKHHRVYCIFI